MRQASRELRPGLADPKNRATGFGKERAITDSVVPRVRNPTAGAQPSLGEVVLCMLMIKKEGSGAQCSQSCLVKRRKVAHILKEQSLVKTRKI